MPASLATLRFPHERVFLARTKLAYIHLRNLLSDAKRDRTARVSGYVQIWLPDETVFLFLKHGEVVNAVVAEGSTARSVSIADAIARVPANPELGEICFHEASLEQLTCMHRAMLSPPEPWPDDVVPADGRSLLPYLKEEHFSGIVEVLVGERVSYLVFRDGLIATTFVSDTVVGPRAEQLARLLGRPEMRPIVRRWSGIDALPVQAPPALVAAYRELAAALVAELDAQGVGEGAERAERTRAALSAEHPALAHFASGPNAQGDPVANTPTLTTAVAAWVTATLTDAVDGDAARCASLLRSAGWERRHMLHAAGFLDAVPWTIEW